jgi:serine/threonine protein kinase
VRAAVAAGAAEALDAVYAAGVHRDLKPANVLLPGGSSPEVTVIDLGIAWPPTPP